METLKKIWAPIKLKLDLVFFCLVSASWFPKLPNKKVIKLEVFYGWMSVATGLLFYGGAKDHLNGVEFSTQYYAFASMWLLGWVLYVGTIFGYNASKAAQEYFWRTQLMRFLNPDRYIEFIEYPNSSELLKEYKDRWFDKYKVPVEWTRANAPFWQKIQIALLIGMGAIGIATAYIF